MKNEYDVIIIGSGPGGLAAAEECKLQGLNAIMIEREERMGGILKQCIHEGFGLHRFKERLTGPEYVERYISACHQLNVPVLLNTFVETIVFQENTKTYQLQLVNEKQGIFEMNTKALILANGCRERTARQVFIHGTRPSGIFTAGTAQFYVNRLGYMPGKKCIILGSGDIGLIMARRLTLEGAEVLGVYEVKNTPSGLNRNIVQCLEDFNIPLHLSTTVSEVKGESRVEAVKIVEVDDAMNPIEHTEKWVECDTLILSVGLIPENEIANALNVNIDNRTKGPIVNQYNHTSCEGIFSCGNALHVNDLVDFVSESGVTAARGASLYLNGHDNQDEIEKKMTFECGENVSYIIPQKLDITDTQLKKHTNNNDSLIVYFRVKKELENVSMTVNMDDFTLKSKSLKKAKPPEMERVSIPYKLIANALMENEKKELTKEKLSICIEVK